MNDGVIKTCWAMTTIVACYAIFAFTNPHVDGAIFASILAAVCGLAGYAVGVVRKKGSKTELEE